MSMNYDEALQYIHGTLRFGSKLGLQNITKLLELLGNPHLSFPSIHVAGTNGKGSTCAFLKSILKSHGMTVGMFISPYLERFTERIQINDQEINPDDLARITSLVKEKVEIMVAEGHAHPTEFEIVTAIGFYYFFEKQIDIAVIEVGLGGRYDSTNVIAPVLSVITSISFDHMEILGNTLEKIAYEKGGIIKRNGKVVVYPQDPEAYEVIKDICDELNAEMIDTSTASIEVLESSLYQQSFTVVYKGKRYDSLCIKMIGRHQIMNAAVAFIAALSLKDMGFNLDNSVIKEGLRKATWPGRLEIVNREPFILVDGAHNEQGARALKEAVDQYFTGRRIILVTGILGDKNVNDMAKHFASFADEIIVTTPDSPRAMNPYSLGEKFSALSKDVSVEPDISAALNKAINICKSDDVMIVSGSLYLVGKSKTILKELC